MVRARIVVGAWIVLVVGMGFGSLYAQAPSHQVGVSGGWLQHAVLDEQASPLRYEGRAWPIGLVYAFRGDRARHAVDVVYGRFVLRSSISNGDIHEEEGWQVNVRHTYARRLGILPSDRWCVFAGVTASIRSSQRVHRYIGDASESFYSGYAAVGPALMLVRSFDGGAELDLRSSMGIIGVTGRPAYSIKGEPVVGIGVVPDFGVFTQNVGYHHRLSHAFTLRLGYRWTYDWMRLPFHLQMVRHTIQASLLFGF